MYPWNFSVWFILSRGCGAHFSNEGQQTSMPMAEVGVKVEKKRAAAEAAAIKVREATLALILTEKGSLKRGVGQFQCDLCYRTYITKGQLMDHRQSHQKERPFPCALCGKRFLSKSHFTEHQRVHTGERPFPCLQCDRSFTTQHNLKRHHIIHVKEDSYRCHTCGVLFCHVHKGTDKVKASSKPKHSQKAKTLPSPPKPLSSPPKPLSSPPKPQSSPKLLSSPKTPSLPNQPAAKKATKHAHSPSKQVMGRKKAGVVTLRRNAGGLQNKIAYDIEVVL
ncbi:hypothetical protein AAFF_G00142220 [Aldrovandia affinis]|uniref:C2H2-type domain-containing protein n=1 Tax=Aldrovandia affinis TaxID=143900 RepID=A0AAD7T0D6_9TELE|nr:hypothetical protein AAFF_G00142220 [Aldrovandia affinis]